MLTDQDKKELKQMMVETVAQGFSDLILPHIDELKTDVAELKDGQQRLETDVSDLKDGQQRLEEGQDAMTKRQTQEQDMLDNLDRRTGTLEKHPALAASH